MFALGSRENKWTYWMYINPFCVWYIFAQRQLNVSNGCVCLLLEKWTNSKYVSIKIISFVILKIFKLFLSFQYIIHIAIICEIDSFHVKIYWNSHLRLSNYFVYKYFGVKQKTILFKKIVYVLLVSKLLNSNIFSIQKI